MDRTSTSPGERIRHELREFIPVALFFLVAFQLLALTQTLLLRQEGIRISSFVAAAMGALIVAKVILIADHFTFMNRFPHKPLIHNVLWRTALYLVGSVVVRYAEQLFHSWRHAGGFLAGNRALLMELNWEHLLVIQLWLLLLLFLYCSASELGRRLGARYVFDLYFTDRHRPPPPAAAHEAAPARHGDSGPR